MFEGDNSWVVKELVRTRRRHIGLAQRNSSPHFLLAAPRLHAHAKPWACHPKPSNSRSIWEIEAISGIPADSAACSGSSGRSEGGGSMKLVSYSVRSIFRGFWDEEPFRRTCYRFRRLAGTCLGAGPLRLQPAVGLGGSAGCLRSVGRVSAGRSLRGRRVQQLRLVCPGLLRPLLPAAAVHHSQYDSQNRPHAGLPASLRPAQRTWLRHHLHRRGLRLFQHQLLRRLPFVQQPGHGESVPG